jgi:hypothetical protein
MPRLQLNNVSYLGGHPAREAETTMKCVLVVDDTAVHLRAIRELLAIPWSEVTEVLVEGPEEAQRRLTATRALTIGIFALGAKKKTGECFLAFRTEQYMAQFKVEKKGAAELRAKLAPWASKLQPLDQPPIPAAASSSAGLTVAEQLTALAALKEKNLLTEEEFNQEKQKLLGG